MAATLMKVLTLLSVVALGAAVVEQDRTITKVVKLLQEMLEKSVKEGDEERVIYAKFKCYCDTSEAEKNAEIKELTEQISLLESKIDEIQGSTGGLSTDCAKLKTDMADNKMARDTATELRKKEHKAFMAEEEDLETAIKQMNGAIKTLGAVGADQTKSTGADNKQFMAGYGDKKASLLSLQSNMQSALASATALMNQKQLNTATAFLQSPFTGTYTSQSAEVMGILKNMRDTFITNLAEARKNEKTQEESYNEFMEIKEREHKEMSDSYDEKQKNLGGNDDTLADDKKSLASAKAKKASDEEFLESLLPMCAEKAKGYANRKLLRAAEEAAISEAISILNSDAAFANFGKVSATSNGLDFLQMRSVHRHVSGDARSSALMLLQKAAKDAQSKRLSKVAALLQANNPFETVLKEIDTMLELIEEEGKADKENLDWCNKERKENEAEKAKKEKEILGLEKEIDQLTKKIEDPKTGLKAIIAETEDSLVKNNEAQTTQTANRLEENVAYQKDIKNLVSAQSILKKAIKALKAYYDDLAAKLEAGEAAFLQEDPTPPEAWKGDGAYAGQSKQGGSIIEMLEFILKESVSEENNAHENEQEAQHEYEDSMTELKKDQANSEKLLAKTQEQLAEAEKNLLDAEEDHKRTVADKEAIEAYLLKIKPGCDFITANFDLRETNRATEKGALEKAITLIKGTPAYKTFTSEATVESYGDCKEPCVEDSEHVKCKACMNDVTIPGYCAGHEGTPGC